MKRSAIWLAAIAAVCLIAAQFYHPAIPRAAQVSEINAPENVKAVLRKDCYGCHSNEPQLAWFDQVQPAYALVRKDVLDARQHLNFSTIGSKPAAAQKAALYEAATMMELGAMPLPRFTALHPDAKVTPADLETLEKYLNPWNTPIPLEQSGASSVANQSESSVVASPNGLPYDHQWHHWKLLAVTDRGDNRQFRMVLGNDVAVRAAKEGNVHPWPDGSRFAKPAWMQAQTPDGLLIPGKFWQVELMVKGHAEYKNSDGWGWGRWRDVSLKPYGKDASVVKECAGCHMPVKGNDYVYTQPFSSAQVPGHEVLNATSVQWPHVLPFDPLAWTPITLFSDPKLQQISVLFAEDSSNSIPGAALHGKVALVTWRERDDPHWFGARMADRASSVETIDVQNGIASSYKRYSESVSIDAQIQPERPRWIASLRAPSMR